MSIHDLRSNVRQWGPSLARRNPNGESERIWDDPINMVRPELAGVTKISVPQERVDVGHPWATSSPWRPTVLGNLVPRDRSKPRPGAKILRK
jgi:hypothetical protein